MKNYKLTLIITLLAFTFNSNAQKITKEVSLNLFGETEKLAKFSLESVSITSSGDLVVGAFIQRKASIDNKKVFQVYGGGYFPGIKLYTFDNSLNKKNILFENVNLNSLGNTGGDYSLIANKTIEIGNNTDDLKYDDLYNKYPNILMPSNTKAINNSYFLEISKNLKKRVFDSRFDILSNSVLQVETAIEKVILAYPQNELLRKEFGYGLANDQFNQFVFASGLYYDKKARKADDTRKYNEFRQYELTAFNIKGELINTHSIDFDYPKLIKFNNVVKTNGKFEGFLYIFGYMPGAKKYNNSETKNKYWALYFDENGKLVFEKEFESQYSSIFYSVHKYNNKLYLMVQGNENRYGIMSISASEYNQVNLSLADLNTNTVNGVKEKGLQKSFISIYDNNQMFVSKTGDMVFVSENKVSKPTASSTIITYESFAVHFNKEGKFIKQYILPALSNSSKSYSKGYKLLSFSSDKIVLLSEEVMNTKPYNNGSFSEFYTSDSKVKVTKNKMKNYLSPVVTVINTLTQKVSSTNVSKEGFVKFSDNYYCTDQENNVIYFAGTNNAQNKLIVSKVGY